MKKKEFICSDCAKCYYSIKEYIGVQNQQVFKKVFLCLRTDLTKREKQRRIKGKLTCEHFKPEPIKKEGKLVDIQDMLTEIKNELNVVVQLFAEVNDMDK